MASWSCIKYADVTRRGGDDTRQRPLRASSTKTSFPQSFLPSTQGRIQCTKKLPLRKLRTDFDSLESRERERERDSLTNVESFMDGSRFVVNFKTRDSIESRILSSLCLTLSFMFLLLQQECFFLFKMIISCWSPTRFAQSEFSSSLKNQSVQPRAESVFENETLRVLQSE